MTRINTNVPAITAQFSLRRSHRDLQVSLERLSTGLRINRGSDNPAGLIVSENLRAEISGITQAVSNSQRAINVIATTEGALSEVNALLTDIQGLIVEAANSGAFSDEEIAANQLQIDSAIDSIARISNTSTFAGRQLLNGGLSYVTSGIHTSQLANVDVFGAKFGTRDFVPVKISVSTSAQQAELQFRNSMIPAGCGVTIDLRGDGGIVTLFLASGTTASQMLDQINALTPATGVEAEYINSANQNSGIRFLSELYGSKHFVSVEEISDPDDVFDVVDRDGVAISQDVKRDVGQDAMATINGILARGDGLKLNITSSLLDVEVTLDDDFGIGTSDFAVIGGGALFQLGPDVNTNQQENIGVRSVNPATLGNRLIGFLSQIQSGGGKSLQDEEFHDASLIVNEAVRQISVLRGRLGAFERNTLLTNINSLSITMENLISSESAIRDTDFAEETSRLTRSQILVSAGTSVLALANTANQSVLSLLG